MIPSLWHNPATTETSWSVCGGALYLLNLELLAFWFCSERLIEMILEDSTAHRTFQTQIVLGKSRLITPSNDSAFSFRSETWNACGLLLISIPRPRLVKTGRDCRSAFGKRAPKCLTSLRIEYRFLKLGADFQNWLSYFYKCNARQYNNLSIASEEEFSVLFF